MYKKWESYALNVIDVRRGGGDYASYSFTRRGKSLMDAIRDHNEELVSTEGRLRSERVGTAHRAAIAASSTVVILTLFLGAVLALVTRRQMLSLSRSFETAFLRERQSAEALGRSERRWAATLRSIGDAVIATDADGKIEFMNEVAQSLTGWTQSQAHGQAIEVVFQIVNEDTRKLPESPFSKIKRLKRVVGLANHTLLIRKDGSELPIDDSGAPITEDDGKIAGVVLIFRDISHRRQMEEKLRTAERLAVAGRFASTIAHEIHNPLDAVGNLLFLVEKTPLSESAREHITSASRELHRVTQMTKNMLSLQRRSRSTALIKLRGVIDDLLTLYEPRIISSGVKVDKTYDSDGEIWAFTSEMRQVFANLLGNARLHKKWWAHSAPRLRIARMACQSPPRRARCNS